MNFLVATHDSVDGYFNISQENTLSAREALRKHLRFTAKMPEKDMKGIDAIPERLIKRSSICQYDFIVKEV